MPRTHRDGKWLSSFQSCTRSGCAAHGMTSMSACAAYASAASKKAVEFEA